MQRGRRGKPCRLFEGRISGGLGERRGSYCGDGYSLNAVSNTSFFKALQLLDYPRLVGLVYNVVSVCLKEEGILD